MKNLPKPIEVQAKRLLELAELAKADREPELQDAIIAAAVSNNLGLAGTLTKILQVRAIEEQLRGVPFREPSSSDHTTGGDSRRIVLIGLTQNNGDQFLYPLDALNQHAFIAGGSGTGKTNLLYSIGLQTMSHCPVWFVDRDKADYRHLLRMRKDLLILDVQDLRFNPLEVPNGVDPRHHAVAAITIFMKSNSLLDGSENMGSRALSELYEERGIFDGGSNYPSLYDLRDKIKSYRVNRYSRDASFQDSLLNRLDAYLIAAPDTYHCSHGFPIADLASRNIVFEVRGLSERHTRCLVNWLLFGLFMHRIANGMRGNTLRNLVIVDEAKYLVPRGYNENLGFAPIATLLAQSREAGIGLIFADQTADLDDAVMVNSRLKIAMRMGSGLDIERIGRTFALAEDQQAYISKLDVGEAIVRMPAVDPFLIAIPRVRLG